MPFTGQYNLGVDSSLDSAAPELLAPVSRTPMGSNPPSQPGDQAGPARFDTSSVPTGNSWGDIANMIVQGAVRGVGIGQNNRMLAQVGQEGLERQRLQKAQTQASAIQNLLSQAYETGNQELISSAYKQLAGLKGLEPEVGQMVGQWHMQQAQKMGEINQREAEAQKFLATMPPEVQNSPQGRTVFAIATSPFLEAQVKDQLIKMLTPKTVDYNKLVSGHTPEMKSAMEDLAMTTGTSPVIIAQMVRDGDPKILDAINQRLIKKGSQLTSENLVQLGTKLAEHGLRLPGGIKSWEDLDKSGVLGLYHLAIEADKSTDVARKTAEHLQGIPNNTMVVDNKTGDIRNDIATAYDRVQAVKDGSATALSTDGARIRTGVETASSHFKAALQEFTAVLPKDANRFSATMQNKYAVWTNDSHAVALFDTLGELTAVATTGAMTAGAQGARGGIGMALLMKNAGITPADNLESALKRAQTWMGLLSDRLKSSKIPPPPVYRETQTMLGAMIKGQSLQTIGSGKSIVIPKGM